MIRKGLLIILALGTGLVMAWLMLLGSGYTARAAPAAELHVCQSCPYSSIQAAVDDAVTGDVIKVAQGTYTDVHHIASMDTSSFTATQIVAITKTITIRGGYDTTDWFSPDPEAYPTILDAGRLGRVIVISGTISPAIGGFHITGGNAQGLGGDYSINVGGGVYINGASAVIISNQIYSNTAPWAGGGLFLVHSDATIKNNIISENSAQHRGGGLYLTFSDATINENTIRDNTAGIRGGGVCSYSSVATITGNIFENNSTADQGGGLYLSQYGGTLKNNIFVGNHTQSGGGLYIVYVIGPTPTLINNALVGNHASEGSGIWFGSNNYSKINTINALHTTLYNNHGGGEGIFVGEYTSLALTNTIIASHTVGISVTFGSTATLDSTLWYANQIDQVGILTHINDHTGDPLFSPDGFHIDLNSAAQNAGVNAGVSVDIDGERRPQGVGYDIGADEFDLPDIYLPLVIITNS